jgi:hypothetical protein
MQAMGRAEDDPISAQHVTSRDEVARFARTKIAEHGPTIPLRLDLDTTQLLSSAWNKRASKVFSNYYRQQEGACTAEDSEIHKAFMSHLHTLHRHFKQGLGQNSTPSLEQIKSDQRSQAARYTRRQKVYPTDSILR